MNINLLFIISITLFIISTILILCIALLKKSWNTVLEAERQFISEEENENI